MGMKCTEPVHIPKIRTKLPPFSAHVFYLCTVPVYVLLFG